jgi:surface protein
VPEGIKHNKWSNKMNRETLRERILKKDYKDINNWDVSDITDMSRMFYDIRDFNEDISNWDVSNVTNMDNMFTPPNPWHCLNVGNWYIVS